MDKNSLAAKVINIDGRPSIGILRKHGADDKHGLKGDAAKMKSDGIVAGSSKGRENEMVQNLNVLPGDGLKVPGDGLKEPGEGGDESGNVQNVLSEPGEGGKGPGEVLSEPGEAGKEPGDVQNEMGNVGVVANRSYAEQLLTNVNNSIQGNLHNNVKMWRNRLDEIQRAIDLDLTNAHLCEEESSAKIMVTE
ncbi:hypothetical protein QVD17_00065 [Tagetes erecta]|uniref:Uncharacterized protein n=1 Tax=Tagetes erecta TaxID=13708 RepID=A0AAD8P6W6_TARER|nr:hypothetical protein QVD17_00065 [Tagetes erecta]